MNSLKVALIQTRLIWENPQANRQYLSEKLQDITKPVDLIILPEMFTSGFTMNPERVYETMDSDTVSWMANMAKEKQAAITGSIVIHDKNTFFNRLIFITPEGVTHTYDKRHTFTLAGEDKVYASGAEKVIINYKGWRICPLICYDLRFPVWARNTENYDLLFYVANWPKPRITAWDTLLKARAIENMSYCIGVNRVGADANDLEYSGHSAAYDGLGELLTKRPENTEHISIVTLQKEHLESIRTGLKFLDDRDEFTIM